MTKTLSFGNVGLLLGVGLIMGHGMLSGESYAAVVRTSAHPNYTAALAALKSGDAMLCDGPNATPGTALGNPPDNVQIIGGNAIWATTSDVRNVVFFNHSGLFQQVSGVFRKCIFFYPAHHSKFTGLDSCLIMGKGYLPFETSRPGLEVNGYLRSTSMVDFVTGNTGSNDHHSGLHSRTIVVNATHPEGDGRGSLLANYLNWGQADWTNVHVINARGLTLAHFNSEYGQWSDPLAIIENGAECALVHMNPGGYSSEGAYSKKVTLPDGRTIFTSKSYAGALFKVSGQHNYVLGGVRYLSFGFGYRPSEGHYQPGYQIRDPFFQKWAPVGLDAVNLAPAMKYFSLFQSDRIGTVANATIASESAKCTTSFVDHTGAFNASRLKPKSLPMGPKMYSKYFPKLPKLLAGLGEDMTGKSGAQVEAALGAKKTIYLGKGTYQFSKTITSGTIYGAGMDETILKFPDGLRAVEDGVGGLYNLSIQGGKVGYAQTNGPNIIDLSNVRFTGQSICAITLGNAQNVRFHNLEFDNTKNGVMTCQDEIPCGEDDTPGGGSMVDKVNFYMCTFKNMDAGINVNIKINGYTSYYGCHFENLGTGIRIGGSGGKNRGHHISGSTFKNCDVAVNAVDNVFIDNSVVEGKGASSVGFTGGIDGAVNCVINKVGKALEVSGNAVVSNVQSTGNLVKTATTWVGGSKFANLNCEKGAYFGDHNLTAFVDPADLVYDNTPPSAPQKVEIKRVGNDNLLTWQPSGDSESGIIQYIIELDFDGVGLEIGRTPLNWKHADSRPTAHDPKRTIYLHKSADAKQKYIVVALNGANIRSDNKMARLRFWEPYDSGSTDSVFTSLGKLTNITAVDYSKQRAYPGAAAGSVNTRSERRAEPLFTSGKLPLTLYDLKGRKIGAFSAGTNLTPAGLLQRSGIKEGLYIIRQGANKPMRIKIP